MAKISDYPDAGSCTGSDATIIVRAGTNFKATLAELLAVGGIASTEAANQVYAGPTTGSPAAPAFRALVAADLPVFVASGASHAKGAVPDPGASSGTAKFLREDATWQTPAGGMTVGSPVSGGTATYLLFVDGSANLGQSSKLIWNGSGLYITGTTSALAGNYQNGNFYAQLGYDSGGAGSYAGHFTDGTNVVYISDGTNHVTYTPATPGDWNGTAPTDVWVALDRLATLVKTLNGGTGP